MRGWFYGQHSKKGLSIKTRRKPNYNMGYNTMLNQNVEISRTEMFCNKMKVRWHVKSQTDINEKAGK